MLAYQLQLFKPSEDLFIGSVEVFILEVRNQQGTLTTPDEPASVIIQALDDTTDAATTVSEMAAEVMTLDDGTPRPGLLKCELDTTGMAAGKYLIRIQVPYGEKAVPVQETFVLKDPTDLAS